MSVGYEDIEDNIIAKLQADEDYFQEKDIEIVALGESHGTKVTPTSKPIVEIFVDGSKYDPPRSIGIGDQIERIEIHCDVTFRNLRGALGVYEVMREIKRVLHGHKLSYSHFLTLEKQGYKAFKEDKGLWTYVVVFTATMPQVMAALPESGVAITEVTINPSIQ